MVLRAQAAAEFEKVLQSAHLESVSLAWSDNYIDYDPYQEVNDEVASLGSHEIYERGLVHLKGTPLPGMKGNFVVAGDRVWRLLYPPWPDLRPFYKYKQLTQRTDPSPIPIYGPFGYLDEAEKGHVIWVETSYGRFKYRVYNKFITQPEDVSILESNNEEIITLITCDDKFNPSGPIWNTCTRLVIQASLVSAELR